MPRETGKAALLIISRYPHLIKIDYFYSKEFFTEKCHEMPQLMIDKCTNAT